MYSTINLLVFEEARILLFLLQLAQLTHTAVSLEILSTREQRGFICKLLISLEAPPWERDLSNWGRGSAWLRNRTKNFWSIIYILLKCSRNKEGGSHNKAQRESKRGRMQENKECWRKTENKTRTGVNWKHWDSNPHSWSSFKNYEAMKILGQFSQYF